MKGANSHKVDIEKQNQNHEDFYLDIEYTVDEMLEFGKKNLYPNKYFLIGKYLKNNNLYK